MRGIIREGDIHSHGGRVESGAANSEVMGRATARVGDRCTCPIHGECVIVEGDSDFQVEGRAAAFDGHRTSCGAVLISSVPTSGRA
ncbi:PAAR domain-containing protein [Burkholderia sp. Ac-20379]|uniref:PAAR domain-containing protein n=1 Tax=Burkholderia sp. Ac-20379 TaxID=2703900 RepID=UPI00197F1340|nr:PAAR domain-containing protein [Burkholderia sp. Ac-20379]MBN3727314.1 PAAR domain-containing protein [Burkholderia sp. Ac-20379]